MALRMHCTSVIYRGPSQGALFPSLWLAAGAAASGCHAGGGDGTHSGGFLLFLVANLFALFDEFAQLVLAQWRNVFTPLRNGGTGNPERVCKALAGSTKQTDCFGCLHASDSKQTFIALQAIFFFRRSVFEHDHFG